MPTVITIDSIKIDVYSREHPPPHFHAKFAEFEELIEIETLDDLRWKYTQNAEKESDRLGG
jgi:hypothetical protein